jgi:NAD kinase
MPRNARSYQIVPIAPYRRRLKPMIAKAPAMLRVACECPADLIVDGQFVHVLPKRSILRVCIAKREMEFVK